MEPPALESRPSRKNFALKAWEKIVSFSDQLPLEAHILLSALFSFGAFKYTLLLGVPAIVLGHLTWRRSRGPMSPRKKALLVALVGLPYLMISLGLASSESDEPTASYKNAIAMPLVALDLETDPAVDEQRFLFAVLDNVYQSWPNVDPQKPASGVEGLKEYRTFVQKFESHIAANKFDPELRPLFQECIDLIDANLKFVDEVSGIEQSIKGQTASVKGDVMLSGAIVGYGLASDIDNNDGSAAGKAAIVYGIYKALKTLYDAKTKGDEIDAAKKSAIEGAWASVAKGSEVAFGNAKSALNILAERHNWPHKGTAFDPQPDNQQQLQKLSKENNRSGLLQYYRDLARIDPMNPFVKSQIIRREIDLSGMEAGAGAYLKWASDCVEVTKLIPRHAVYDTYRLGLMRQAGDLALTAISKNTHKKSFDSIVVPGEEKAVVYWKTTLKLNPVDVDGGIRWNLGVALAGVNLVEEAHQVLSSIANMRGNDPTYHYLLARLDGFKGRNAEAFDSLQKALASGFTRIDEARACSDFSKMRSELGSQADRLLDLRYQWDINYGIVYDDITLTNNSSFTLTDVILIPEVTNRNGKFKPYRELKLDILKPGESHKWTNCISITGGKPEIDRKTATLHSSQGKL